MDDGRTSWKETSSSLVLYCIRFHGLTDLPCKRIFMVDSTFYSRTSSNNNNGNNSILCGGKISVSEKILVLTLLGFIAVMRCTLMVVQGVDDRRDRANDRGEV